MRRGGTGVGSSTEPTFSTNPESGADQLEGWWGQEPAGMMGAEHPHSGAVWGNEHRGAAQCQPRALGWA